MTNVHLIRSAQSLAVLAISTVFATSAFAADSATSDGHDAARHLLQPVLPVPAPAGQASTVFEAHQQAVALIVTGSGAGTSTSRQTASRSNAVTPALDPHQFAREHLRWNLAAS